MISDPSYHEVRQPRFTLRCIASQFWGLVSANEVNVLFTYLPLHMICEVPQCECRFHNLDSHCVALLASEFWGLVSDNEGNVYSFTLRFPFHMTLLLNHDSLQVQCRVIQPGWAEIRALEIESVDMKFKNFILITAFCESDYKWFDVEWISKCQWWLKILMKCGPRIEVFSKIN